MILKENHNLLIYPEDNYQIIIPIGEIISASTQVTNPKLVKTIVINTKERGYEIAGVANRKKAIELINLMIQDYEE